MDNLQCLIQYNHCGSDRHPLFPMELYQEKARTPSAWMPLPLTNIAHMQLVEFTEELTDREISAM